MEILTDYQNRQIRLTEERLQHILDHPEIGAKWLCVVIKDNSDDAFIITAYLTDKLKQGLELWRNL